MKSSTNINVKLEKENFNVLNKRFPKILLGKKIIETTLLTNILCACFICVQLFGTLWTCSPPDSSVHGVLRQEYWVSWHALLQGIFPTQGLNPTFLTSPALEPGFFTTSATWEDRVSYVSDQIRSVAQSCPTLCDPMNRSTPGLPVHHQLLEFTETHVHLMYIIAKSYWILLQPPCNSPGKNIGVNCHFLLQYHPSINEYTT